MKTKKTIKDPVATPMEKPAAKASPKGAKNSHKASCTETKFNKFKKKLEKATCEHVTNMIALAESCGVCPTCAAPAIQSEMIHGGTSAVLSLLEFISIQYGELLKAK